VALHGHIDEAGEFAIHGWAHNEEAPDQPADVEVAINDVVVGTVRANLFRPDLRDAGYADGRKAFWFDPFEFWTRRENKLEIRFPGSGNLLVHGSRMVRTRTLADKHALWVERRKAEGRWQASQPGPELTWGG
jgi:hypothetical protein